MPTVIPVKFKYATRDLWFDPADSGAVEADHVICRTARGREIGIATGDAREVSYRELKAAAGEGPLRRVERVATDADLELAEELAERGEEALPVFRRLVEASGLDMKPVGVEWLFSGERVVCYFSAEERVDFRQLVRELSRELRERVDMRQIGVREEAAIHGGFAHCGQELCCARFGRQFEPVSIRMAKEQDLPLNSTKISGACGRLMCCLRYEFEAYRDFKGRAPKRNAVIETPLGKAKIIEYDTPKEQLALRLENGKQVRVALADMVASEAAVKKSEELGCACRPDTVTREALERLQSPDVQMALAELDRQMGIASGEVPDEGDIFVSRRPRRRRRGGSGADEQAAEQAREGQGASRRRRRKKRAGGEAATGDAGARDKAASRAQGQGAGQEQPSKPRRRRRRHVSSGQGGEGATDTNGGARNEGGQQPARRPRRRPGDRGGAQAGGGQGVSQGSPEPAGFGEQPGDGTQRRRRRRHRGGRGRSGKGGDSGGAPTA